MYQPGSDGVDDTPAVGKVLDIPDLDHRSVVRKSELMFCMRNFLRMFLY